MSITTKHVPLPSAGPSPPGTRDVLELDVETLPFRGRHDRILRELDRLRPGEHVVLVSDHMPLPFRFHLQEARPGRFRWSYLKPDRRPWRIEIMRIAS